MNIITKNGTITDRKIVPKKLILLLKMEQQLVENISTKIWCCRQKWSNKE